MFIFYIYVYIMLYYIYIYVYIILCLYYVYINIIYIFIYVYIYMFKCLSMNICFTRQESSMIHSASQYEHCLLSYFAYFWNVRTYRDVRTTCVNIVITIFHDSHTGQVDQKVIKSKPSNSHLRL